MSFLRKCVLISALCLSLPASAAATPATGATPDAGARVMRFAGGPSATLRISSTSYDRAQVMPIVATLRGLIGAGRAKVNVYVADSDEITRLCGPGTMSCYDSYSDEITISGADEDVAGVPRDYALAHEYGHHLANHSGGSLWPAMASGTMRWATEEHVCELTRSGQIFPGNESAHYWENPGEAYAQTYAELNYPGSGVTWSYSPLLAPSAESIAALRADVDDPWEGPSSFRWSEGTESRSIGSATYTRAIKTPLDGRVTVSVAAEPGSRMRITLRDPATGEIVAQEAQGGGRRFARLAYPNCGLRSLELEISDPSQVPFRAHLKKP